MTTILIKILFAGLAMLAGAALITRADARYEKATFAGGCFWCMEAPFERLKGVIEVVSGYTGGRGKNPTYEDYASKGHLEAIQITYDPTKTSYSDLLEVFWRQIDPTDESGQFADRGSQYKTAIFYHNEEQKKIAEESKKEVAKRFDDPIATEIIEASEFYEAEEYHQDYYLKRTQQYNRYKKGSGREDYIKKTWEETDKDRRLK